MKIYNQDKTKILENVDLSKGYLLDDEIIISQEESHWETTTHENGGISKFKVVDKPEKKEKIQVFVEYSAEKLNQIKLAELTNWFDNYFDKQFKQSQWQKNFKVSEDPYFKDENGKPRTYADIEELKAQAEIVREEIKSLRNEV